MTNTTETTHTYWTLSPSERAGAIAEVLQGLTRLPLDDEDRASIERVLIDAIVQARRKVRRLHPSGFGFIEETR